MRTALLFAAAVVAVGTTAQVTLTQLDERLTSLEGKHKLLNERFNVLENEVASKSKASRAVAYPSIAKGQKVANYDSRQGILTLRDGSAWDIRGEDTGKIGAMWSDLPIIVYRSEDANWPYKLILNHNNEYISQILLAKYLGGGEK